MFCNLSEEELLSLAIEYIVKGVDLPKGSVDRLGEGTVTEIRITLDADPSKCNQAD